MTAKTLSLSLCVAVFMLVIAYGFMVNKAVLNVVARQNIQKEAATLRTAVGELESSRMALRTGLTERNAQSRGYVAVAHPIYIVSKQSEVSMVGTTLGLNTSSMR